MNIPSNTSTESRIQGYVEGYYGKLFSWHDRASLVSALAENRYNTYCYAPKEDPLHRLNWREPYDDNWRGEFRRFTQLAEQQSVSVAAGIAPGLDFDFTDRTAKDFSTLTTKARQLIDDGASHCLLLWDDIEETGYVGLNGVSEGQAHAETSNLLSDAIGAPVWVVPRVYAAEITNTNDYLEAFFSTLDVSSPVLLCGNAIVSKTITLEDLQRLSKINSHPDNRGAKAHRLVLWDNFYANDYCPRQLFLGPWSGREHIDNFVVNLTGLPCTDRLLLNVVRETQSVNDKRLPWRDVMQAHGVPDAFALLAGFFDTPVFGDDEHTLSSNRVPGVQTSADIDEAIETCLWKWKSPLAREWYPFIMSLKHDLAIAGNTLPRDRILKTQTAAMASRLLR